MVRSSYIIIVSSMGDDVPIFGAPVTFFGGNKLLLILMMFPYINMVGSSNIIILSGMGYDMPILGVVVTLFEAGWFTGWFTLSTW